jgi:thymidylate synthase (FAD)
MKISKQSVELVDFMGSDLSVVNAARVSFAKESDWEEITESGVFTGDVKLSDKDAKLISYLAKHNHWSPFAHNSISLRIKAPIFAARQMVKHQVGLVWNEVSRRYVDDEPEYFLPSSWRSRPENVKQGSGGIVDNYSPNNDWLKGCHEMYLLMLEKGIAPEQARMVLPQNTMTEWIWTGSLMAFARVCKQRLDPHAQAETQEVAKKINNIVEPLFPVSWKALMNG